MNKQDKNIHELFELANHYPSPHNGQPIEARQTADGSFELYFQKERGLQAAEVSLLFSYVTMGVFICHLSFCAQALGHKLNYQLMLPPLSSIKGEGAVKFAEFILELDAHKPDETLLQTLLFRQTSRKKYSEGLSEDITNQTIAIAKNSDMKLVRMDKAGVHQAIWLNQRAVFDDMFDDAVRRELNHWLRYSKREKEIKKDGLSYDCMELNGRVMKFIVRHYKLLHMPVARRLLKQYYLRTMSDGSDVFYLLAPFSTEKEAFDIGMAVMDIWRVIAGSGDYLHPFGTIMSNEAAHRDFLKLAGIAKEDIHDNFLAFIYRAGKSKKPNASLRIPIRDHLLRSSDV